MAKRIVALALVALVSGGCAYMRLQQPPAQGLVKCGILQTPFWYWQEAAQDEVYREADCIETHMAEGYQEALPEAYFFIITAGSLYTGQPTYTKMP